MTRDTDGTRGRSTRRRFLAATATTTALAGFTGTSLAGCGNGHDDGGDKCPEDPPGQGEEHADPPGHNKDATGGENDPGGEAHDYDDGETDRPGKRLGHCKFDPDGDTND